MVARSGSRLDDLLAAAELGSGAGYCPTATWIESGGVRAADIARALTGRPRRAAVVGLTGAARRG